MKPVVRRSICLAVLGCVNLLNVAHALGVSGGLVSANLRFVDFAGGDFTQNPNYLLDGFNLSGLPFDANGESYLAISDTHVLRGHQGSGNPLTFDVGGVLVDRTVASSTVISYSPTAGSNDNEITVMTLNAPITIPQLGDPVYDPTLFAPLPILTSNLALNFVPPPSGSWPVTSFGGGTIGFGIESGYGGVPLVVTGRDGRAGTEFAEPYLGVSNAVAGTGNPFDFFGVTDVGSQSIGEARVVSGDSDGGTVAVIGGTPIFSGGRIVGYSGGQLAAFGSANWITVAPNPELNGFTLPGYYLPQLTANGVSFTTLLIPEPSRAVMIGLGTLIVGFRRRR